MIKTTHVFIMVMSLLFGMLFMRNIQKAEAIGATLETPTIKDMYFGFAVVGLISRGSYSTETLPKLYQEADKISNEMLKFRGKK